MVCFSNEPHEESFIKALGDKIEALGVEESATSVVGESKE